MSVATTGNTVTFHYTGTLSDGTTFDSSQGSDPMAATLGQGQLIPGFESALMGMASGEIKTFTVGADEAYGQRRPDLVQVIELDLFPEDSSVEVGQRYEMVNHKGDPMPVTVVAIEEDQVTIDANHPLAGQDLTFELEVVEIQQ